MPTTTRQGARGRSSPARIDWTGWIVGAACVGVLVLGFSVRDEQYVTPDDGTGYALGITGATLMLSILIYSARKRVRWLRGRGQMAHWMRAHIAVGLLGPIAILYHSNFRLGSTNSNVALFTMLAVAGSGIVGRYLYRQVHRGLHGRQLQVSEIWQEAQDLLGPVGELRASQRELVSELEDLGRWTRANLGRTAFPFELWRRISTARSMARHVLSPRSPSLLQVESYLSALVRTGRFALYERLFRSWHALHVPLFALLVATVVAHVVAVHRY